jgi:hypothetical protein
MSSAKYVAKDLNFKATQISDCTVVSAEISPAGALNIIKHCWLIALKLLNEGVLCRGVITRGNILHTEDQFIGTGYIHAYQSEKSVKFLQANEHEEGTPFIELQQNIVDYIKSDTDPCVRDMVSRMTHSDGNYTAIYPFHALGNAPFAIVDRNFDPHEWKGAVQKSIGYRAETLKLLEDEEARAEKEKDKAKVRQYKLGLQQVIDKLKRKQAALDRMITTGHIPYGTSWGSTSRQVLFKTYCWRLIKSTVWNC